MNSAAPSREKLAQAKLLYDAGVAPVSEILALLGMSVHQFRRFRQVQGWPLRASPISRAAARSAKAAPAAQAPAASLIARLEDAVEREFARAEVALQKHAPKTIEQSARTLASLVRTLGELKRMKREAEAFGETAKETYERDGDAGDQPYDEPPRELAQLRAELARRLGRLNGEGAAG
jgi:hypothetical protein